MRLIKIYLRANWHDPSRIHPVVTLVVVAFDMVKVNGVGDFWDLIEFAGVAPQIGVVDNAANVALEMAVVDWVEANERGE